MAKARKDHRGRALRKGEVQRKDKSYMYTYTDPYGKRRYIYANDLVELREKEKRLMKDQLDGLDVYAAGNADLNFVFDRYIATKTELRRTTYTNYTYMYDRFVRGEFGKRKIGTIKYSDVLYFYYHLLNDKGMQINTLETIHTVLHPTFQLAVRDDIIRNNPSDGVMAQIKKKPGKNHGVRHCPHAGTAESLYGLHGQQSGILPLGTLFHSIIRNRVQDWRSNRAEVGGYRLCKKDNQYKP